MRHARIFVGSGGRVQRVRCLLAALSMTLALAGLSSTKCTAVAGPLEPEQAARSIDQLLAGPSAPSAPASRTGLKPVLPGDQQPIQPTECSESDFLRRVYLDLVGRLPTPDEVVAFALDASDDKRQRLIMQLLASDQYARNWARYWRDVIYYRRSEDRALLAAPALTEYLTEQFAANTPWDEIARSFVTATGDVRENGNTALVFAQRAEPVELAAEVSRVFLGIQIQCAQCHDHPTDRWQRAQFHELAAFFPRVALRPNRSADQRSFVVVSDDAPVRARRPNAQNRVRGTPEHYMPDLDNPSAPGTCMQPVFFVSGQSVPLGTRDLERRTQLAQWLTAPENPWFAKAVVNRIWTQLVGSGFYDAVDDIGPDRPCRNPEGLDYLSAQFVSSGFDLKWLFATIAMTRAYQSGAASIGDDLDPGQPQRRWLRGEELLSALTQTLDLGPGLERSATRPGRFPGGPAAAFNQLFGYDPSLSQDEVEPSVPQVLALMNSPALQRAIDARRNSSLRQLVAELNDEALIVELYLRSLGREPTEEEISGALGYFLQVGDRHEATEDLLWALINSTEFRFRN